MKITISCGLDESVSPILFFVGLTIQGEYIHPGNDLQCMMKVANLECHSLICAFHQGLASTNGRNSVMLLHHKVLISLICALLLKGKASFYPSKICTPYLHLACVRSCAPNNSNPILPEAMAYGLSCLKIPLRILYFLLISF